VDTDNDPVTVSVDKDGLIFIDKTETSYEGLLDNVAKATGQDADPAKKPVFVRADGRAPYQAVARVMARLSTGGFTKLNLITDTASDPQS
jgi:biopolymer transport protein TolR